MLSQLRKTILTGAVVLCCLAIPAQDTWAKGGGGKGKGGRGGGRPHAGWGAAARGGGIADAFRGAIGRGGPAGHRGYALRPAVPRPTPQPTPAKRLFAADHESASAHPWSMQRANEARKLEHRLGVADKLDQLAERNGNPNLHETAARQREKAWEHYEKRLAKINSQDRSLLPPDESGWAGAEELPAGDLLGGDQLAPGDPSEAGDATDRADEWDDGLVSVLEPSGSPTSAAPELDDPRASSPLEDGLAQVQRLTGRENALYRQLQNEQRKLAQRMEVAEQLWQAYEQSGNERLADAARAFEERALAHFEQRMNAISDFQQRHGLADVPDLGPQTVE